MLRHDMQFLVLSVLCNLNRQPCGEPVCSVSSNMMKPTWLNYVNHCQQLTSGVPATVLVVVTADMSLTKSNILVALLFAAQL